jgi:hypothetical protein
MGRATIVANMGEGRYTIEIDFGQEQQAAIVANLSAQILKLDTKIIDQQVIVVQADAEEAAQRAKTTAEQEAFIAAFSAAAPGDPPPDQGPYQAELMALYRMRSLNRPKRSLLASLKQARTNAGTKLAAVQNVITIERRNAWCVDYTLTATGVVATLEVPGEQGLILIQPGGRAYVGSDGTMLLSDKVAIIAKLGAERDACITKLATVDDKLAAAKVSRDAAAALLKAKTEAFISAPSYLALSEVTAAQEAYDEKNAAVVALEAQARALKKAITDYQKRIAYWADQPASENPQYGDGNLRARELLSPEQAYWNVSALPGWQKHKPMFRTGVLTAVNNDADVGTVDLDHAASSAQSLDVNARQTLVDIPIDYMDCDAQPFDVGDRVVVEFGPGGWDDATVIGFVDTPRQCCDTELLLHFPAGVPYSATEDYLRVPGYPDIRVPCGECGGVNYPMIVVDQSYIYRTASTLWEAYEYSDANLGALAAIAEFPWASNGEVKYCALHIPDAKLIEYTAYVRYHGRTGCVLLVGSYFDGSGDRGTLSVSDDFGTPGFEPIGLPAIIFEEPWGGYSMYDGREFTADMPLITEFGAKYLRATIRVSGELPSNRPYSEPQYRVGTLVAAAPIL